MAFRFNNRFAISGKEQKMAEEGVAKEVESDKKIVHTYPLVKVRTINSFVKRSKKRAEKISVPVNIFRSQFIVSCFFVFFFISFTKCCFLLLDQCFICGAFCCCCVRCGAIRTIPPNLLCIRIILSRSPKTTKYLYLFYFSYLLFFVTALRYD